MLPNLITVERRAPSPSDLCGPTGHLYDAGEETWPLKIHLGNGGIYLRGYLNVDIAGQAARYHPEMAEANAADIWNYYARLEGSATALPVRRPTYADLIGDLEQSYSTWGLQRDSVDKVVCVQMLEHLSPVGAMHLLRILNKVMRDRAPLILSVPDMEGTVNMVERGNADDKEFAIRHLRGSRRDSHNYHKSWWTAETLTELLNAEGFACQGLQNFHLYPAIVVRAERV